MYYIVYAYLDWFSKFNNIVKIIDAKRVRDSNHHGMDEV